MEQIEIGDHVRHEPSGEEWVVARIAGDLLFWCGWPTGCTKLSECTLIEKASPASRAALIDELKRLPPSDSRHYADNDRLSGPNAERREGRVGGES